MSVFLRAVLGIAFSMVAAQATAFEFKGFPIGESQEAFLQLHHWKCTPVKPQHGPYDEICLPDSFPDKTYMGKPTQLRAYVLDGRVVSIEVDPWRVYFNEIVAALTEKYGPPTLDTSIPDRRRAKWKDAQGNSISLLEKLVGENGFLTITSAYGADEIARRRAAMEAAKKRDM
ncbi:hypothetical protein [Pigmentiphaga kullae]|nr:hypothetical protein [Pigmentiphaga kullae]